MGVGAQAIFKAWAELGLTVGTCESPSSPSPPPFRCSGGESSPTWGGEPFCPSGGGVGWGAWLEPGLAGRVATVH